MEDYFEASFGLIPVFNSSNSVYKPFSTNPWQVRHIKEVTSNESECYQILVASVNLSYSPTLQSVFIFSRLRREFCFDESIKLVC